MQTSGFAFTLQGPALRALGSLGLLDACIAAGHGAMPLPTGTNPPPLPYLTRPSLLGEGQPVSVGIKRPIFANILVSAARSAGARVTTGTTVERLTARDAKVEALLTGGRVSTFDLVIGADGLHSGLRRMAFPDSPEPKLTGQNVFRSMMARLRGQTGGGFFFGRDNKVGFNLVSADETYCVCVTNRSYDPRPPRNQWPALMRAELAPYSGLVADARERITDPEFVDLRPLSWICLPPPWHRGRILLIGDAAHATTPHLSSGAALAIEDAVVLAEILESSDDLERFMQRRYDRCRKVVEACAQLGEWELHPSAPGANSLGLIAATEQLLVQPI